MKTIQRTPAPKSSKDLPKTYAELCELHLPRPIHSQKQYRAVVKLVDLLAVNRINKDQSDYLLILSNLIEDYEDTLPDQLPKLEPHEFLTAHLENIGMSAAAWGKLIGIDRSTASRLLRGERKLNTDHIRKTSDNLGVSPELLF